MRTHGLVGSLTFGRSPTEGAADSRGNSDGRGEQMLKGPRVSALVGALAFAAGMVPAAAHAQAPASVPQVVQTGTAPTGYEVTFRISDPSARRMRIKGEWF